MDSQTGDVSRERPVVSGSRNGTAGIAQSIGIGPEGRVAAGWHAEHRKVEPQIERCAPRSSFLG